MSEYKKYRRDESAIFLKTSERFGGLSNMAGGYPLTINGVKILTSEALYQACRFPDSSEVQKLIIGQKSPMTAKMKSKPFRKEKSRPDWDNVRVRIMYWCLRVKLAQHWEKFGELLLSTGNMSIVEESYRDQFWGAKPLDSDTLCGENVLGRLLTKLRENLKGPEAYKLRTVDPLPLEKFYLIDKPIGVIGVCQSGTKPGLVASPQALVAEQLSMGTAASFSYTRQQYEENHLPPFPEPIQSPTTTQAEISW